jgi:hypothetical protein
MVENHQYTLIKNKIQFSSYKEIHIGAVAKSYMRMAS